MSEWPLSDYSGNEFPSSPGEVYGYRMWKMSSSGYLQPRNLTTGPTWLPGVNQAVCRRDLYELVQNGGLTRWANALSMIHWVTVGSTTNRITFSPAPSTLSAPLPKPSDLAYQHPAPDPTCRCGFYAYFSPDDPEIALYASDGFIFGAVKAYGRTLIGTRGFRAERAEIVAFLDPTRLSQVNQLVFLRRDTAQKAFLLKNYPGIPVISTLTELSEFVPKEEP